MDAAVSNAFARLDLDVEEDREETAGIAFAHSVSSPATKETLALESDPSVDTVKLTSALNLLSKGDNRKTGQMEVEGKQPDKGLTEPVTSVISGSDSGQFKSPLVWIDLEMTGLDVEVDRILEAACIITDGNLSNHVKGPNLVIHQTKDCLDKMNAWCQENHGASGLTERVLKSEITEKEAERQLVEFVKKHVGSEKPHLAGNSVYTDYIFLKKYMPDLACLFSHVLVDVSSIKALCIRWFPKDHKKAPRKENKHRALDDITESILELKYYKEKIFKQT